MDKPWRSTKTQGNLVEEIGGRMASIEVAGDGDVSLRRPRPTQGCTAVMMMKVCINRHYQHQNGEKKYC